jgi:hypothetical protein
MFLNAFPNLEVDVTIELAGPQPRPLLYIRPAYDPSFVAFIKNNFKGRIWNPSAHAWVISEDLSYAVALLAHAGVRLPADVMFHPLLGSAGKPLTVSLRRGVFVVATCDFGGKVSRIVRELDAAVRDWTAGQWVVSLHVLWDFLLQLKHEFMGVDLPDALLRVAARVRDEYDIAQEARKLQPWQSSSSLTHAGGAVPIAHDEQGAAAFVKREQLPSIKQEPPPYIKQEPMPSYKQEQLPSIVQDTMPEPLPSTEQATVPSIEQEPPPSGAARAGLFSVSHQLHTPRLQRHTPHTEWSSISSINSRISSHNCIISSDDNSTPRKRKRCGSLFDGHSVVDDDSNKWFRCFGRYKCGRCGQKWSSGYTWVRRLRGNAQTDKAQLCSRCRCKTRPYKLEALMDSSKRMKHDIATCGMCKSLGHSCCAG